jgi:hypothetical protein
MNTCIDDVKRLLQASDRGLGLGPESQVTAEHASKALAAQAEALVGTLCQLHQVLLQPQMHGHVVRVKIGV